MVITRNLLNLFKRQGTTMMSIEQGPISPTLDVAPGLQVATVAAGWVFLFSINYLFSENI